MNKKKIILSISVITIIVIIFTSQNYNSLDIEDFDKLERLELKNVINERFPDIYYIILDEYSGNHSLIKDFGFDNSQFLNELKDRGFIIPEKNFSNYPNTALSLPSMLNMQYMGFLSEEIMEEKLNDLRPTKILRENNLVIKNLKSQGYYVISFYSGADSVPLLVDEKPCNSRSMLLNFDKGSEILCTFSEIPKISKRVSEPLFVYSHMSLPHGPYIFDRDGNDAVFNSENLNEERDYYLEQLKFTNSKTIELIDLIIKEKSRTSIIILQSDHGQRIGVDWEKPTDDMIIQSLNNFNAYYLPDVEKDLIYDGMTPVNTFRIIFNAYFNQNFEILEDRHFWVNSDREPYNFLEVTDIIDEFG